MPKSDPENTIRSLIYTAVPLDRAGVSRKDAAWVEARLGAAEARFVAVWRNRSLVVEAAGGPEALMPRRAEAPDMATACGSLVFLGLGDGDVPYFGVDLSDLDEHDAVALAGGGGSFVDLRQLGWMIPREHAGVLAYARGLAYWHRNHGFCGYCGSATASQDGGHMRKCTNPDCGRPSFPRTDPAVIMLVEYGGKGGAGGDGRPPMCLLGRSGRWEFPLYSTLAGFVEPGESLEEAVRREVLEEVNVRTDEVRYMASQPWPFPASLMLGFRARATTTEIECDPDEIVDARWFTAEEVRAFKEWDTAAGDEPRLPRRDSIARWLVQSWLDDVDAG